MPPALRVFLLFCELFPAEVGFLAGEGELFGEAQACEFGCDGVVGCGGLVEAAQLLMTFGDGPGGIQPVRLQLSGPVPVGEGLVRAAMARRRSPV